MHVSSPWPPDLACTLTQWPWPIFCAPLTSTQFTLTFQIFLTIRRTTTKPCIVLLLDVLTRQVPWPGDLDLFLRSSDLDTFCVDVRYLLNYKAYNHQTLQSVSSQCTDLADTLTCWPWPIFCAPLTLTQFTLTFQIFSTIRRTTTKPCIVLLLDVLTQQVPWPGDLDLYFALQWLTHPASTFNISSTIRPTTIKPCKVLLLNVLTRQIPWPGDLDLYFGCSDFDIIYFNVPDLLKCKTSSHQTLHSASSTCTDSAGTLTQWPWSIFCAPVPFTHFMSTFTISSTIRPTTIEPCIVLLLNVRTPQVPWLGDLDLYFALHWLLHILRRPSICPQL